MNTLARLEYLRDKGYPFILESLRRRVAVRELFSAQSNENARIARDEILSVQNDVKAIGGELEGLRDSSLMQRKRAAEHELRSEPLPPPLLYGTGPEDYGMILNLDERSQAMNDEEIWNNFEQLSMLDYYRAAFDETPTEIEPRVIATRLASLSGGSSPVFGGSGET